MTVRAAVFALAVLAGCARGPDQDEELDLTLRMGVPGQACVDAGFVGWMVEVRSGSAAGDLVASAYIEPFAWPIDGESLGLDDGTYVFGDYWAGVLPPGDYDVRAYGVTDPGPPPVIATFMTPAEAMVTLESGHTSEVVLVTSCDTDPGALDVIIVVDGGPTLLDFDIDMKWVAACEDTTFTATLANPERDPMVATWEIRDEQGQVILSETDSVPSGAPDPVEVSFTAWTPVPGDYTGTLTVTSGGSTSVFAFPWHVRIPGIAVGACEGPDGPMVLLSCDPTDGVLLVDDPACLEAAYGDADPPTCDDLVADECFDDPDPCPLDDPDDSDLDGVCDSDDPCPLNNPDDPDGDGVCGNGDEYPCDQLGPDRDGDGTSDACDLCPDVATDDSDFDGVCDDVDQCPGERDRDDDRDGTLDCLEHECTTNCTYSAGFWKLHPADWPVQTLVVGGVTYTARQLQDILATPPKGDATYIVAQQLIAARLNVARGADGSAVTHTMADADAWLVANRLGTEPGGARRDRGLGYATILERYNNGVIGPGQCDASCPVSLP